MQGHIQRIGSHCLSDTPCCRFECAATHHLSGGANQRDDDLQLGWCQADLLFSAAQTAALGQHLQVVVHQLQITQFSRPTHQGAHACPQLFHRKGLGQVIVRTGVQPIHPIMQCIAGGQHQTWHLVAGRTHAPHQLKPVAVRQTTVNDHQCMALSGNAMPGGLQSGECIHGDTSG